MNWLRTCIFFFFAECWRPRWLANRQAARTVQYIYDAGSGVRPTHAGNGFIIVSIAAVSKGVRVVNLALLKALTWIWPWVQKKECSIWSPMTLFRSNNSPLSLLFTLILNMFPLLHCGNRQNNTKRFWTYDFGFWYWLRMSEGAAHEQWIIKRYIIFCILALCYDVITWSDRRVACSIVKLIRGSEKTHAIKNKKDIKSKNLWYLWIVSTFSES